MLYQTLKTVFDHISKHLEVHQKYSATRRIFDSLLGVRKCDQTRSLVFDILLIIIEKILKEIKIDDIKMWSIFEC